MIAAHAKRGEPRSLPTLISRTPQLTALLFLPSMFGTVGFPHYKTTEKLSEAATALDYPNACQVEIKGAEGPRRDTP